MSKLLIFGSGFLAKHIIDEFIDKKHDVKVIYNNHKIIGFNEANQFSTNETNVIDFINEYKPNYLLFSCGDSFVGDNTNVHYAINKNLTYILTILENIQSNNCIVDKIIIIGSAAEYGKLSEKKMSETEQTHPTSIYGLTKILLHNTAMYYTEKGLPIIYTRQFNVIGPNQRDCFVLSSFSKQIALIEKGLQSPAIFVGNLSFERDFIDARDNAKAYYTLFEKGIIGEIYNVGSGVSIKIQYLLDLLLKNTNYIGDIEVINNKKDSLREHNLNNILLSDNTKLKSLGFKCDKKLDETVIDTLNYWRNNV
jgi:GDP-4-dehydro-6-deoxy-D-mannose reductase